MPTLTSVALNRIKPSPTVEITGQAQALKRQGRDIIALSSGEPDFDTPAHIRDAAKQAIDEGRTRYTAVDGIAELKEAIVDKFRRDNGLTYRPEQISVGTGGKQVLFNALMATLDPGHEVIIPAPYWVSYPDIVRLAGAEPVIVPCPSDAGFKLTPEALEAAITPATKWVILNSPGNPTGAVLTRDDLADLAEVLRRHPHVLILTDDIYEHILFDGLRFATIAAVATDLAERTLTLNGVSKAYAMTGWRIGFGAGPRPLIAAMAKLQSQSTSNPCTISQYAALAALTGPQDYIPEARTAFQRRRDLVVSGLNDCAGINCPTPQGAFYVFPSVAGCLGKHTPDGKAIASDSDFCGALLDATGVALVPGAAFGLSPHVRLSYAADDKVLSDALTRMQSFCASLS